MNPTLLFAANLSLPLGGLYLLKAEFSFVCELIRTCLTGLREAGMGAGMRTLCVIALLLVGKYVSFTSEICLGLYFVLVGWAVWSLSVPEADVSLMELESELI